jgi:hypothetical protein
MKSDVNTLATYPNPMMNFSLGLNNQLMEMQNAVAQQCVEAIRSALTPSFAEFAKSLREMQISMAKSLMLAINPLAINFEPATYIQEAEVIDGTSALGDIALTVEGQFLFQRSLIHTMSAGSKHGKFLKMMLTFENNFVSDNDFRSQIDLADEEKGIGYVRRDLKKYLRLAGLEANILRVRKFGHKLISIRRIAN